MLIIGAQMKIFGLHAAGEPRVSLEGGPEFLVVGGPGFSLHGPLFVLGIQFSISGRHKPG